MFAKNKANIDVLTTLKLPEGDWCNDAKLIAVQDGKGALKRNDYCIDNNWELISDLTLNDVPLLNAKLPGCPTCAGMLATGYGVDSAKCNELNEISDRINADFVNLETSIENIKPLLGLLSDGLYVVADINANPTDGCGNFFWAAQNKLSYHEATGAAHTDEDSCMIADPVFIYPTQSTDFFDEERVQYYLSKVGMKNSPRAISFYIEAAVSALIDGHHKATAAALKGVPVNCLMIIPLTWHGVKENGNCNLSFSLFGINSSEISATYKKLIENYFKKLPKGKREIPAGKIINRTWESKYLDIAKSYLTLELVAEADALQIYEITDALLNDCIKDINTYKAYKLRHILDVMSIKKDNRVKNLAIICAGIKSVEKSKENRALFLDEKMMIDKLHFAAFTALAQIKDDPEVEQFFINYLIWCDEPSDVLKAIADNYWNQ